MKSTILTLAVITSSFFALPHQSRTPTVRLYFASNTGNPDDAVAQEITSNIQQITKVAGDCNSIIINANTGSKLFKVYYIDVSTQCKVVK